MELAINSSFAETERFPPSSLNFQLAVCLCVAGTVKFRRYEKSGSVQRDRYLSSLRFPWLFIVMYTGSVVKCQDWLKRRTVGKSTGPASAPSLPAASTRLAAVLNTLDHRGRDTRRCFCCFCFCWRGHHMATVREVRGPREHTPALAHDPTTTHQNARLAVRFRHRAPEGDGESRPQSVIRTGSSEGVPSSPCSNNYRLFG